MIIMAPSLEVLSEASLESILTSSDKFLPIRPTFDTDSLAQVETAAQTSKHPFQLEDHPIDITPKIRVSSAQLSSHVFFFGIMDIKY
jgi:hypothetical protein